jgi:hypothetical protein
VLGLIGATVAVALVVRHDGSGGRSAFSPTDHQVTYEVGGNGTAAEITYSVGANTPTVLHKVGLPWQITVKVAVGVGGEVVNLVSTNPGTGRTAPTVATPLICRILVDGQPTAQRTSTDGYAAASCSASLYAKRS